MIRQRSFQPVSSPTGGLPTSVGICDYILRKKQDHVWQVEVVTEKAFRWISVNYSDRYDHQIQGLCLSLHDANMFWAQARNSGLSIQLITRSSKEDINDEL